MNNKLITIVVLIMVWLQAILYYSYILRAIAYLGFVPSHDNPDPSNLFPTHRSWIYFTAEISLLGIFLGIIALVFRKKLGILTDKLSIILFVVGTFLFFFALTIDPFNEWFLD